MKKLMIAAAIVCAAVISQAATCNWQSGALKTAAGATGGWSATGVNTAGALVTMNVYFLTDDADLETGKTAAQKYADLAGKTQKEIFDAYSTKTADLTGVNKNSSGNLIGAVNIKDETTALEAKMYAVVIGTYTDATHGDMFMATAAESSYNGSTKVGSALNVLYNVGTRATDGGWQAVPEPTSGLLLLLGVAGLALRRRRA